MSFTLLIHLLLLVADETASHEQRLHVANVQPFYSFSEAIDDTGHTHFHTLLVAVEAYLAYIPCVPFGITNNHQLKYTVDTHAHRRR